MPIEVQCALIGALGSIIGVLLAFPLTNYRIKKLEEKVDKHNNLIERTYKLEADVEYLKREVTAHV